MQYRLTLASAVALASSAYAQTVHEVSVVPGQLAFEPNTLSNVAEGDSVRVTFGTQAHNLISGSWDNACEYNSDLGVNSGIHMSGEVFVFQVNSTNPEIYFCSVGSHCQAGMALAINPTDEDTYEQYATAASSATTDGPDSEGPEGGVLETEETESSTSSSSESMASATSSMESTTESMPTATSSETSEESMPSETSSGAMPAATTAAGNAASGLQSSFAMVGALGAGALAFVL
ncbi:putative cupredoxin [Septoria linicola]|nr:putative cupredoxin [Septoria linicola]